MKDAKKSKTPSEFSFLFVIYMTLFIFSIILIIISAHMHPVPTYTTQFKDYSEGWVSNGELIDLSKIDKSMRIEKELKGVTDDAVLFFRVKNLNILVEKDGDVVYTIGTNDSQALTYYKTPGTYFVSIPLSVADEDKIIAIDISCPYSNSVNKISEVYLGNEGAILRYELSNKLFGFSICLLIAFIGLLFIFVSIPLRKYDNGGNSLLYLGLFALCVGVWALTEVKFMQLLFDNPVFWHFVSGLTLILIPTPVFIFFRYKHEAATKAPVFIIGVLTVITYVISIFLHLSGIVDLHETIKLTHILLGFSALFAGYYAFRCFIISKYKDIAFYGLLTISVCAALDIIFYYTGVLQDNSTLTRIGVLIYICVLGFQVMNAYIKNYNTMLKADWLSKLAYVDILTEFYNRTSFTEDMQTLDDDPNRFNRIIAVFDMNNLKAINDTYGHTMGDKAIIEASERISEHFGTLGKCYRIGGDEFVFISSVPNVETEVQKAYKALTKALEYRNSNNTATAYTLLIAFGYAIIDATATEAFNKADSLMYANKKAIKGGRED